MGSKSVYTLPILFEKKMDQAKGRKGKKQAGSSLLVTFCTAYNNNYVHI
jgi:hypothetical protein